MSVGSSKTFISLVGIFLCLITFIAALIINYLSTTGKITSYNENDIANRYPLQIIPADWTFELIWAIIYIWQALWQFYILKRIIFNNDLYLGGKFYFGFILSNILNLIWIFLWCNNYKLIAGIIIIILTLILYLCVWILLLMFYGCSYWEGKSDMLQWKINILLINGIAFYATWTSIATCLNWGILLKYKWNLNDDLASMIALAILGFGLMIYFIMNVVFNKYFDHIWSPFFVFVIAFGGILSKNGISMNQPAIIMVIALFILVILGYIMKMVLSYFTFVDSKPTTSALDNV